MRRETRRWLNMVLGEPAGNVVVEEVAAARAQPFRFVGVAGTDPCASVVPFGSSSVS